MHAYCSHTCMNRDCRNPRRDHMISPEQKKTLKLNRRSWDDVNKAFGEIMKDDQTITDETLSAVAIDPASLS